MDLSDELGLAFGSAPDYTETLRKTDISVPFQ